MENINGLFCGNLNFIYSATGIGLWDWEIDTGKVIYSPEWEAIAGYEPGELDQTVEAWSSLVYAEDMPEFDRSVADHMDGKTPFYSAEFRMRKKDGTVVWAQDKGVVAERHPDGRAKRIVGVIQDITDLKRAKNELTTKNEQLDFIAKLSGLGIWDWCLIDNSLTYNNEYLEMLGYEQSEIEGTLSEWESMIHPDDVNEINQKLDDYVAGRSSEYTCEVRMRHKDGHYIWTMDLGRIVEWAEDGTPTRILGGHLNIAHIKKAEAELQSALSEIEEYNKTLSKKIEEGVAQLEEERQASQALYDSNPQMNFIASRDFQVLDCNPSTLRFYGYENKEDFKRGLFAQIVKVIPETMPNGTKSIPISQRFADVAQYGETSFDTVFVMNGEEIPFHFDMKRVPYKGSWVVAIYQTDLRALKKAEQNLEHRDRLLSAVNSVASRLMLVESEDFEQSLFESIGLLGKSSNVQRVTMWKNFEADGELHCTQVHEWCDGVDQQHGKEHTLHVKYSETIPTWEEPLKAGKCVNRVIKTSMPVERAQMELQGIVSMLVVPIFIRNEFWGFVGYDDCVNERIFSEAEETTLKSGSLLIASALMRDEMTSNLVAAKEAALSSANAKTAFLANMSHEIRTPMNAIIGMTTIAKNSDSIDKMNDCLEKISVASKHLLGILNDILDMSKIEAQKFELADDEFDFEKMIKNICVMTASKIEEKCLTFDVNFDAEIPKMLIGDELRFSQIITNLLSNAVKFTPEHGKINLSIKLGEVLNDKAEIITSITDTGIGISAEQQKTLFNAFEQADRGISRKFGGTGLGLAISKNIVDLMGGSVYLESEVGKGSCFSFNVYMKKGKGTELLGETIDDVPSKEYDFTGKRILLVEDVDINREIIIALLEDTNVEIESAENGQIGYEMFLRSPDRYDLIFMDIHMPVMDGYAATRTIREIDSDMARQIPIVAMTANAFKEDIEKCKAAGMNDHVAKPVDIGLLLDKMYKYL